MRFVQDEMADVSLPQPVFPLHAPALSRSVGSWGCFAEFWSHTKKKPFPLSNANLFIPPYSLIFSIRDALSLEIIQVFVWSTYFAIVIDWVA